MSWDVLGNVGDLNSYLLDWGSKIHMGFRLQQREVLDDQIYESWEIAFLSAPRTPGGTEWWSNAKAFWPRDFRERIDFMVSPEGSDIPPWSVVMPWYAEDA